MNIGILYSGGFVNVTLVGGGNVRGWISLLAQTFNTNCSCYLFLDQRVQTGRGRLSES